MRGFAWLAGAPALGACQIVSGPDSIDNLPATGLACLEHGRKQTERHEQSASAHVTDQRRHAEATSRRVEERGRDVEDGPVALVLHQDTAQLGGEALDAHRVGHQRE